MDVICPSAPQAQAPSGIPASTAQIPIPIPTAPKAPEPGPPRGRHGGCQHKGMTLNSTGPWNKLLARVYIYRTYAIYTPLFFCISL